MKKNVAIGFIIGLVICFGIYLVLQIMDNTIWLEDDIIDFFKIPVLGSIPKIALPESTKKVKEVKAEK